MRLEVVLAGLCWVLRAHIALIMATVFGVLTIAGLTVPERPPLLVTGDPEQTGTPATGPVIHIVLDGQAGLASMPGDDSGAIGRQIGRDYLERGFRVFGRAISRYSNTRDSLTSAMNFTEEHESNYDRRGRQFSVVNNRLFRRWAARGHAIHVIQSTYLNYCDSAVPVASCATYEANTIKSLEDEDFSTSTKVAAILNTLVSGAAQNAPAGAVRLPPLGRGLSAGSIGGLRLAGVHSRGCMGHPASHCVAPRDISGRPALRFRKWRSGTWPVSVRRSGSLFGPGWWHGAGIRLVGWDLRSSAVRSGVAVGDGLPATISPHRRRETASRKTACAALAVGAVAGSVVGH